MGGVRGRPAQQMTHRRQQVFEQMEEAAANGEPVTLARLARRCGLYDYRAARRIVHDLRKMGHDISVEECGNGRSASAAVTPNRIRNANRRAAWFGAQGKITVEEVTAMMERQGTECALCSVDLAGGYHIDHIVSLRAGGGNTISNVQLLCGPCNIEKG